MKSRLIFTLAATTATLALLPATAGAATISSSTATPLVDNFVNDSVCSLREMVAIANNDNAAIEDNCTVVDSLGDDTINLGSGTYALSIPLSGGTIADGDLEVEDFIGMDAGSLIVDGQGRTNTFIDGNGDGAGGDPATTNDRVFEAGGAPLRLKDLTVQDGQATGNNGGGIVSSANLILEQSNVTANRTTGGGAGGGVLMSGSSLLTISNSSIDNNTSSGTGGGVELRQSASLTTEGGAAIKDNTAASQGGGINVSSGPLGSDPDVTLNQGASVENNNAVALGGGIAHTIGMANSDLTIIGAGVKDNDVTATNIDAPTAGGGGISWGAGDASQAFSISSSSEITGNTVTGEEAAGGGIAASTSFGTFSISDSTVANNTVTVVDDPTDNALTAEGGGGIKLTGVQPSTVTRTVILDNTADVQDPGDVAVGGGILDNGTLTIDSSALLNNKAQGGNDINPNGAPLGGGLYAGAPAGPTGVINSTFSGNEAVPDAGGSSGGGLSANISGQPLTVAHTTFAGNLAGPPDDSPGWGDAMSVGGAPLTNLTLRGLVIDEGVDGCAPANILEDSNAYNVDAGTSCVGTNVDTDLRNAASINLDSQAINNGGPTPNYALLAGSQAIDFVPNTAPHCRDLAGAALTVDQRGFTRPDGTACDAGSFEVADADDDNDGVLDVNDGCPTQAANTANGCPGTTSPTAPTTPTTTKKRCPKGKKLKKVNGKKKCVKKKKRRR